MKDYKEIIRREYEKNNLFFQRFLINYKEKYGEIDEKLEENIFKLEKNKQDEKLLNKIVNSLERYVKEIEIRIVDMTLREGDQAPGGGMNRFEKAILALYLKESGVDVIELGFAANPADYHNINYILDHIGDGTGKNDPYLSTLCRATIGDVEKAIELFKRYDKPRIHIFYATSEKHMDAKVKIKAEKAGITKEEYIIRSFLKSLEKALELKKVKPDFEVEISFEDAGNTKKEKLLELSKIIIDRARLDNTKAIINLPSTLGDKISYEIRDMFSYVYKGLLYYYKDYKNWELSAHNHNDNAEALGVSLESVRSGAENIETSLLGLGEGAGNTQTHIFFNKINEDGDKLGIDYLEIYKNSNIKMNMLGAVSRLLEDMFLVDLYTLVPYIGGYVHKNSSGVHAANGEVYRTLDSLEKYGGEKAKEFFSSRGGTNQITEILKKYDVDFTKEISTFKKIYILRIQREAEIVKTLYPATMYAIYKELKGDFKIKEIFTEKDKLKVKIKIFDKEIELIGKMEDENGQIAGIMNAISLLLGKDTKFDLTKVPRNKAVTPIRKIIGDFRNSGSYIKNEEFDLKIDEIIKESEKFELVKDFYYKIDMFYTLLVDYKDMKNNDKINKSEIDYLEDFLNISKEDKDKLDLYILDFAKLKNFLEELIYKGKISKQNYEKIKINYKIILDKFALENDYKYGKQNIKNYLKNKNFFDNMFGQTGIVYVETELNGNQISSQAISKSLTKATVKAIIYSVLKEIEKKIIGEKDN